MKLPGVVDQHLVSQDRSSRMYDSRDDEILLTS